MSEDNKFAFMLFSVIIIIAIMTLLAHLYGNIQEEKMAQIGCNQVYIPDRGYHWECGKDK